MRMNEKIISNWNRVGGPEDIVFLRVISVWAVLPNG
jgi:hypothetical protein